MYLNEQRFFGDAPGQPAQRVFGPSDFALLALHPELLQFENFQRSQIAYRGSSTAGVVPRAPVKTPLHWINEHSSGSTDAPRRGFGAWGDLFTGYNADDLQKESADLDAQLAAVNRQARDKGTVDEATYQATVAHLAQQIRDTQNIPADIDQAWVDGALEGYHADLAVLEAIPKYAGRVTGDVLGALGRGAFSGLGALPWWLWVAGGLALFLHLGGGKAVEFQARKRIARYAR